MHAQMDAMIHFMAILFGAEVVARFIGDSAFLKLVAAMLPESSVLLGLPC